MFNRPQNTNCQMIKLFNCSQIHVMGNIVFALITHKIVKHIRYCLISFIFFKEALFSMSLFSSRKRGRATTSKRAHPSAFLVSTHTCTYGQWMSFT